MASSPGLLFLKAASALVGVLFVAAALRAATTGVFKGPRAIVHGTPTGVSLIRRAERPFAFWACVCSYAGLGLATTAAALLVL
ncbi:MAG: hypothetical protein JNM90_11110 [Burkholderiales bacterium]|nr:hypothetical protein [Burkholderiales bacterium]